MKEEVKGRKRISWAFSLSCEFFSNRFIYFVQICMSCGIIVLLTMRYELVSV